MRYRYSESGGTKLTAQVSELAVTTEASKLGPMQAVLAQKYLKGMSPRMETGSLTSVDEYMLEEAAIHHGLHFGQKELIDEAMLGEYLHSPRFYSLVSKHLRPALDLFRNQTRLPFSGQQGARFTDIVIQLNNDHINALCTSPEYADMAFKSDGDDASKMVLVGTEEARAENSESESP